MPNELPPGYVRASIDDLRSAAGEHIELYKIIGDTPIFLSGWVREIDTETHPCFPEMKKGDIILRRRRLSGYAYDDVGLIVSGDIEFPTYIPKR